MPTASISPSPEFTYAVDFNGYVEDHYNQELASKGTLRVRATEPRFVFTGCRRGTFVTGKTPIEISFRSDQIWNVVAVRRGVHFSTNAGKSTRTPFVFTCGSLEDTAAIVAAMPATKDAGFLADEGFIEQVRELPGASGFGSVTNLILLAIGVVFVVMGLLGAGWVQVANMQPYMKYGANYGPMTVQGQWWRLITSMFMHYGLLHLLLNAWALFQVGHLVEKLYGRALFTLIYFGSGLVGGIGTLLWNGTKASAGASGAVFGIYGALIGYLFREKQGVPAGIFQPMLRSTLLFAGYNLFFGAVHPNIDNAAHIGGLLGGVLLGWIAALPLEHESRLRARPIRSIAAVIVTVVLVAAGIVAAGRARPHFRPPAAHHPAERAIGRIY